MMSLLRFAKRHAYPLVLAVILCSIALYAYIDIHRSSAPAVIHTEYDQHGKIVYEGEWQNGRANGEGKTYYPNGTLQHEGTYAHGNWNGAGTLYDGKGNVLFRGAWLNGNPAGTGIIYNERGGVEYKGDMAQYRNTQSINLAQYY